MDRKLWQPAFGFWVHRWQSSLKTFWLYSLPSLSKTVELTDWAMKFFSFEGWWAGFSFLVVGAIPIRPSLFVRRFLGKLWKYSEDLFTSKGNKEGKYYSLKYKQEEDKTVLYTHWLQQGAVRVKTPWQDLLSNQLPMVMFSW